LRAIGLLTDTHLLDRSLSIVSDRTRNAVFGVLVDGAPRYFVKWALPGEPASRASIGREAAFYTSPAQRLVARLVPRFIVHDDELGMLVIEMLDGADNLAVVSRRTEAPDPALAASLGTRVGELHSRWALPMPAQSLPFSFGGTPPWVLDLCDSTSSPYGPNAGHEQLIAALCGAAKLRGGLEALRAEWRCETLIHGDLRWENVLIHPGSDGRPAFKLIDWETVDAGDPAWDAGTIVQSYLASPLLERHAGRVDDERRFVADLYAALDRVRPALSRFWQAYARARGIDTGADGAARELVMRYAAARMVQTVFEYLNSHAPTPRIWMLIQFAENLFADPAAAAVDFLS